MHRPRLPTRVPMPEDCLYNAAWLQYSWLKAQETEGLARSPFARTGIYATLIVKLSELQVPPKC